MSRRLGILLLGALVAVALALGYRAWRARLVAPPPAASAPPAPGAPALVDPLRPDAAPLPDASRQLAENWVGARPAFQSSRAPAERGGVEPCATQSVDDAAFASWLPLSRGRLTYPQRLASGQSSEVDLILHLHGDEPIRRELIESGQELVLLAMTLPPGQGYAPLFSAPGAYRSLIAEAEQTLGRKWGRSVLARKVALSAWSAGFVGIAAALSQPDGDAVDAVLLIDGLHAPRGDRAAFEAQLQPFVRFARRAAAGERFMFISHSSIDPPDFASTSECAHYLVAALDGKPLPVRREDRFGLELVEYFTRAGLHVRGYAGNDKADHCAQLALLRDAFRALGRRWQSPGAP